MFNLLKKLKSQEKKIKLYEEKIKNHEELDKEHNSEWVELYTEKKELEAELAATIESKDIAEKRNVEYARTIKAIADELNTNQYNSVLNLSNKIKSMLAVGKHF